MSQPHDESKSQTQEALDWIVKTIGDRWELEEWQTAFFEGAATLEAFPQKAWERVYFGIDLGSPQGEAVIVITSSGAQGKNRFRRLFFEDASRESQVPVPYYRWSTCSGDEPESFATEDV